MLLEQVFRCLASLWSIDTGSITKPGGGNALAGRVFYLPLKPYQVLGTLYDQISCEQQDLSESWSIEFPRLSRSNVVAGRSRGVVR